MFDFCSFSNADLSMNSDNDVMCSNGDEKSKLFQ